MQAKSKKRPDAITAAKRQDNAMEAIARNILGIETLEERKSDALDFHDLSVWNIRMALLAAFELGRAAEKNGGSL